MSTLSEAVGDLGVGLYNFGPFFLGTQMAINVARGDSVQVRPIHLTTPSLVLHCPVVLSFKAWEPTSLVDTVNFEFDPLARLSPRLWSK